MLVSKDEWILLADRAHAKIFTRKYANGVMTRHWEMEHPAARRLQHDFGVDRPGHGRISGSGRGFAYEDHANFPEQESEAFLHAVADALNRAAKDGEIGKLTLVALPKTMATLKSGFTERTMSKISGEYAKNMIGIPEETLPARIAHLKDIGA